MTKPAKTYVNPYLIVEDVDQALALYEKAFGFVVIERSADEQGKTVHAETLFNGELIMFGRAGAWGARACTLQDKDGYVWCVMTPHTHAKK